MYYYVSFVKLNINSSYYKELFETLNRYYGQVIDELVFSAENVSLILRKKEVKNDLEEFLINFIMDNLLKSKVYISNYFDNIEILKKEININNKMLLKVYDGTKVFYFNSKTLNALYLKSSCSKELKKHILKDYYDDNEMLKTLQIFFDCNLNVLLASKELSIHRNTLNYRLKKFEEVTGYDVRCFNDAFIIKKTL